MRLKLPMRRGVERLIAWGFGLACSALLFSGMFAIHKLDTFVRVERQIAQSYLVLQRLDAMLAGVKDADAGVRSFLLTADPSYLDAYHFAPLRLRDVMGALRPWAERQPEQAMRLARFEALAAEELSLLAQSVQAAAGGRSAEAIALVRQGEGRRLMDGLGELTDRMQAGEVDLLDEQAMRASEARQAVWWISLATVLLGVMLALLLWSSRDRQARQRWRLEEEMRRREAAQQALRESERTLAASERHFRAIAESLPQLVWSADPAGRVDYFNGRWYEFTGMSRDGDDGWQWMNQLHRDDLERVVPIWTRCLATGEPYEVELRLCCAADGSYRWFMARALPVRDADGRISNWFGTFTDIDDYRRLTERLRDSEARERASRELAEDAGRSKDEFVSVLSHELRTPLNAVLGWTQVLQRLPSLDDRAREALRIIERNARMQAQLIADLFDLNRMVTGKLRLDAQPVDLAEVVGDAIASVSTAAKLRGVTIETELDDARVPAPVTGDAARLHQVMWNLLSNAVKFTPAGGTVKVVQRSGPSSVELSVIDSGEGIDPEALPHLFERYYQAGGSAARGGLGLGLSIVRTLVEMHGGTVSAHSAGKGAGARFTVRLPVLATLPDASAALAASQAAERRLPRAAASDSDEPAPGATRLDAVRVLMVDDDRDSRELVRHVLEARGAQVALAADAAAALGRLAGDDFDVLVSDIGMAGMDGYTLVRQMRALGGDADRHIPAVALTALARAEDRTRALTAGFQAHLSKPVDVEELVATIASLHGLRRAEATR